MSHLLVLTFLNTNLLPFATVLILTAVSIISELDSTKNIEAITVDIHRNMIARKRRVDHFFSFT